MGGFALYDPSSHKFIRTLEITELESLFKSQTIPWPTITEEQIADRSKADVLSKGFVLLQTGWFIAGCIGRGREGLPLTEMEVMTLAFAVLAGIVCWLWWDKPMDVMRPFPIYETTVSSTRLEQAVVSLQTNPPIESPEADSNTPPPSAEVAVPSDPPVSLPELPISAFRRLSNLIRHERRKRGWLKASAHLICLPFSNFFQGFDDMISLDKLRPTHVRRVPTFYSPRLAREEEEETEAPDDEDDPGTVGQSVAVSIAIFVELLFGAIHCVAWNNTFPSNIEKWLWRVSAVLILTLPLSMTVLSPVLAEDDDDVDEEARRRNPSLLRRLLDTFVEMLLLMGVFFYFIARLTLLVLPFLQLRDLPPGAFVDIHWVSLFPHIS